MSRSIPDIVRNLMRPATDEFLASTGLALADMDDFVCHPGGVKVLQALEATFGLSPGGLSASRAILREFGNMSAVTVMFVLKRVLETSESVSGRGTADPEAGRARRYLMTALGPGFSIGFVVLESD